MKHAREDYNRIQEVDRAALDELMADVDLFFDVVAKGFENETKTLLQLEAFQGKVAERYAAALTGTIPADEPVFLIRAQDEVGHAAVRAWAHLHRQNGGSDPCYLAAMKHADLMEQWPNKKKADMPQPTAPSDLSTQSVKTVEPQETAPAVTEPHPFATDIGL